MTQNVKYCRKIAKFNCLEISEPRAQNSEMNVTREFHVIRYMKNREYADVSRKQCKICGHETQSCTMMPIAVSHIHYLQTFSDDFNQFRTKK